MGKKEKRVLILSLLLVVLIISSYVYSLMNRLDDIVFFDHEITLYEKGINYQRIYYITNAGDTRKVIGLSFNDEINLRASYDNEEVRNFGLYDLHIAYLEVFIPQTIEDDILLENPRINFQMETF